MNCLLNVIYGCVTHGASQRCRKSRATQSCTQIAPAIRSSCSRKDGSRLRPFSPSSISISSTSWATKAGRCDHGRQDRFYSEAFRRISRTATFIREQERRFAERHSDSCIGGFSPTEEEAWVNGHEVGTTRFNWNIGSIVCCRQSGSKFMNCWCRTSDGLSKRQRFRRN